jgi:hypothetical protein
MGKTKRASKVLNTSKSKQATLSSNYSNVTVDSVQSKTVTHRDRFNVREHPKLLRPLDAAEMLEPFLELANVELSEADALEQVPEPRTPTYVDCHRPEFDEAVYDRLIQLAQHMRMRAENRAKREQFGRELVAKLIELSRVQRRNLLSLCGVIAKDSNTAALDLYELRHAVRSSLRAVASAVIGTKDRGSSPSPKWQVPVVFAFEIDSDGRINASAGPWGPFQSALERIDGERIRNCRCGKYFYALRKNQSACSERCAHVERTRRWREKQGEYELSRKLRQPDAKGDR